MKWKIEVFNEQAFCEVWESLSKKEQEDINKKCNEYLSNYSFHTYEARLVAKDAFLKGCAASYTEYELE